LNEAEQRHGLEIEAQRKAEEGHLYEQEKQRPRRKSNVRVKRRPESVSRKRGIVQGSSSLVMPARIQNSF